MNGWAIFFLVWAAAGGGWLAGAWFGRPTTGEAVSDLRGRGYIIYEPDILDATVRLVGEPPLHPVFLTPVEQSGSKTAPRRGGEG